MFFEWDSVSICNFFDCYRFLANFAVKSVMQWVAWGSYRAPDFYSYVIVNYRRLKAGGIPLHRIPIEKTHKESSVHVFVPLVSICFVRILCRDPLLLLY